MRRLVPPMTLPFLLCFSRAATLFATVAAAPAPVVEAPAPAPLPEAAPTDARTGRLAVPWKRVSQALARNDLGEAQRLAALLPSSQWQAALTSGAPKQDTAAALAMLPDMLAAPVWLPYVATWILANAPAEAELAEQAIRVAGLLLADLDPASLHTWEIPESTVVDTCAALRSVAAAPRREVGLRLTALDALARASRRCPPPPPALAADPAPAIRRAAMRLLPTAEPTLTVLKARMEDDAPPVAAAAAARLCRQGAAGTPDPLALALARRLAADGKPGTADPAAEDVVDLLDCLAASGQAEDRSLLETIGRRGTPALRTRALELLARPRAP